MGSDESRFNVSQLWGTKSQDSIHRPQLLKRKESRNRFDTAGTSQALYVIFVTLFVKRCMSWGHELSLPQCRLEVLQSDSFCPLTMLSCNCPTDRETCAMLYQGCREVRECPAWKASELMLRNALLLSSSDGPLHYLPSSWLLLSHLPFFNRINTQGS